jgi:uncharacterized protein (DUF58 family)
LTASAPTRARPSSGHEPAAGPVRWRITRAGAAAGFAALVLASAALNTANNLLYLLLAVLLASAALSAWLCRSALRRTGATLLAPGEAVAGSEAQAAVRLAHERGWAGAPALVLEARGDASLRRAVPWLARGASTSALLPLVFPRRGPRAIELWLRSSFPFGLMEASRRCGAAEVLVLPRPDPAWRRPPSLAQGAGEEPSRRAGHGTEILNIRGYEPGEDARRMDWKATARLQRPMVREFEREEERRAALVVDGTLPEGPGEEAEEAVERAIARAAGAAEGLAAEGWRLRVVWPEGEAEGGLLEALRGLARVPCRRSAPGGDWWRGKVPAGEALAFFRAGAAAP